MGLKQVFRWNIIAWTLLVCCMSFLESVNGASINCTGCNYYECNCGIFNCGVSLDIPTKKYYEKGLYNGSSTGPPLVDREFIYQQTTMCPCTYLRIDNDCMIQADSGFYLGSEMNIMDAYKPEYAQLTDDNNTINLQEIAASHGIDGNRFYPDVVCTNRKDGINNCMAKYDAKKIKQINDKYINMIAAQVEKLYDDCKVNLTNNPTKFRELPLGLRTAIFASHYYELKLFRYADP